LASIEEIKQAIEQVIEKAKPKLGDEIKTWNRVFQFELSDSTAFYIEISGGEVKVVEGRHERPTAVLKTDPETLEKMLRGELDAMKAFMFGKLKITGNVIETMKLRRLLEAARE
jgi:putative sterol carrier protein